MAEPLTVVERVSLRVTELETALWQLRRNWVNAAPRQRRLMLKQMRVILNRLEALADR